MVSKQVNAGGDIPVKISVTPILPQRKKFNPFKIFQRNFSSVWIFLLTIIVVMIAAKVYDLDLGKLIGYGWIIWIGYALCAYSKMIRTIVFLFMLFSGFIYYYYHPEKWEPIKEWVETVRLESGYAQ